MRQVAMGVVVVVLGASCGGNAGGGKSAAPAVSPAPPAPPHAPTPPSLIPEIPAGKALAAWLAAFNSGDAPRLQAFVMHYRTPQSVGDWLGFRKQTGAFELLAIETRGDKSVVHALTGGGASATSRGQR